MLYQETFQSGENPSEINVSCCKYINGTIETNNFGFPSHCHSFFELEYMLEGVGETDINGKKSQTTNQSLLILPPLCVHGSIGHHKSVNMILQFGYNFLSRNSSTLVKNSLLVPSETLRHDGNITVAKGSRLEQYLLDIAEIVPSFVTPVGIEQRIITYSPEYEWKLNALTLRMIAYLMECGYLKIARNTGDFTDVAQIQTVLNRLVTRPEEKLSMEEAAHMACMSYSNFCRTFSKIVGRSFVDYCNDTKVHRAEELLKSTNLPITEISQKLGYGSVSYFNRIFKNYTKSSPLQYRKAEG